MFNSQGDAAAPSPTIATIRYTTPWGLQKLILGRDGLWNELANPHGGRQTSELALLIRNVAPGAHQAVEFCWNVVKLMASVGHPSANIQSVFTDSFDWMQTTFNDEAAMQAIAATNPKMIAALVRGVESLKDFAFSDDMYAAAVELLELAGLWKWKGEVGVGAAAVAATGKLLDPRKKSSADRPLAVLVGLRTEFAAKAREANDFIKQRAEAVEALMASWMKQPR